MQNQSLYQISFRTTDTDNFHHCQQGCSCDLCSISLVLLDLVYTFFFSLSWLLAAGIGELAAQCKNQFIFFVFGVTARFLPTCHGQHKIIVSQTFVCLLRSRSPNLPRDC
jgi:hypothetical protein